MNLKKIELALKKNRSSALPSSLPTPVVSSMGDRYRFGTEQPDLRTMIEESRRYERADPLVSAVVAKLSADIAGEIVTPLKDRPEFDDALKSLSNSLGNWVRQLLIDGNLFVHVLASDDGSVTCAVSVDHQPYNYQRVSDRFDSDPTFLYYYDGRSIAISEPIVHARIQKAGRYGRPLFYSGFRDIDLLLEAERHEAMRRFHASVMTTHYKFDQYATPQQMAEFLKSISPTQRDDVFKAVATQQDVSTTQGDGNVDKIQFLSYLLGRIDPLSPVPLPILSFSAAASVNRDTLTAMMREYRATLGIWREAILEEIVRPVLYAVATAEGIDVTDEIESTSISSSVSLSPLEVQQVIATASLMRSSGLVSADDVAKYVSRELGLSAEDTIRAMIDSADVIGAMDT